MSATAPAIQEAPALDLTGLRQMTFKQLDELYRTLSTHPMVKIVL